MKTVWEKLDKWLRPVLDERKIDRYAICVAAESNSIVEKKKTSYVEIATR